MNIETRDQRGIERATTEDRGGEEGNRDVLVPTAVRTNGRTRTEMLPANNPAKVARILKERRSKSPAAKLRSKMAADLKKRTSR
jgi:hypothetical protein